MLSLRFPEWKEQKCVVGLSSTAEGREQQLLCIWAAYHIYQNNYAYIDINTELNNKIVFFQRMWGVCVTRRPVCVRACLSPSPGEASEE